MFFRMLVYRFVRFVVSCLLLIFDLVIILYIIAYNYSPSTLHHSPILDWFIHGFVTATDSFRR